MSESNYKNLSKRGQLRKLQRGGNGRRALVEYESLPVRFKEKIIDKYGDPYGYFRRDIFKLCFYNDSEAAKYYAEYRDKHKHKLTNAQQRRYRANAEILNAIDLLLKHKKKGGNKPNGEKLIRWEDVPLLVKGIDRQKYPHSLPKSERRLREKYKNYKTSGYEALINKNLGNKNTVKVKSSEQKAALRQLLRKHNNFNEKQIANYYNTIARPLGWKEITARTVGRYKKQWDLSTYSGRKGLRAFEHKKSMLVKRYRPSKPMIYWTVDGWVAELLYQRTDINKKGQRVTTYHHRPTIVVVLDPFNYYPVGYAIGTHETPALIKAALRNAVRHTSELFGKKHMVYQLQSDRYGLKKLTPVYESISQIYTPARAHNPKAKVIEQRFLTYNRNYCQPAPNWSGFGVNSRKENQPNTEYLNKIRHTFPDYKGVEMQLVNIIDKERAQLKNDYLKAYEDLRDEDKYLISHDNYLYHLGETTAKTIKLAAEGISPTINGIRRAYDSFDINFRRYPYKNWTISYDPDDLSRVLAHTDDGKLQFLLEEKYKQPMALFDRKNGDALALERVKDFNSALKKYVIDEIEQDAAIVDSLFAKHEKLNGTMGKLILSDSLGQYKKVSQNAVVENAKRILASQNNNKDKMSAANWRKKQEAYHKNKIDINKYLD